MKMNPVNEAASPADRGGTPGRRRRPRHLTGHAVVVVVLSLLAGCQNGRALRPDDGRPSAHLGLIVFAAESARTMYMTVCRERDLLRCVQLGPLPPKGPPMISVVEAGRWCVQQVVGESATVLAKDFADSDSTCFEVDAGLLTYPGHFIFRTEPTQFSSTRVWTSWQHRDRVIRVLLDKTFPKLADVEIRNVTPAPFERRYEDD